MSKETTFLIEDELWMIAYEILDNIVCPIAHIGSPIADIWIASINDHTLDEEQDKKIMKKIDEKYDIEISKWMSAHDPLILIALRIYLGRKNK